MKQLFQAFAVLASLLMAHSFVASGYCELITVEFAGTVTSVSGQNRPELQGFDFPDVGDAFTGFYKFDSTAQDTANSAGQGSFHTLLPDYAVVASIGEFMFHGLSTSIVTFQNQYAVGDHLPKIELTSDSELAQIFDINHFALVVKKNGLYPDPNTLPLSPPPLESALQRSLGMVMDSRDNHGPVPWVRITATLDFLEVVPEPASLLLLGFASIFTLDQAQRYRTQS